MDERRKIFGVHIELCKHGSQPISDQNSQMIYYKYIYEDDKRLSWQWTIPFETESSFLQKKSKSFTAARKSMSKLVKLPSLVAKYCKTWQIYACKVFHILQYFAIKLGSFTNFNMLFLASVKILIFLQK